MSRPLPADHGDERDEGKIGGGQREDCDSQQLCKHKEQQQQQQHEEEIEQQEEVLVCILKVIELKEQDTLVVGL